MILLTKEQILTARSKRRTQIVPVPEWFDNGAVIVMELSGKERDAFEADMIQMSTNGKQSVNLRNVRAKLAGRSIVNPDDFTIEPIIDAVIDGSTVVVDTALDAPASPENYRAVLKEGHEPHRLFNDIEINDLGDVSAAALQRVFEVSQQLSGITKKDVDELTGDLKNVQSGNSGTN